MSGKMMGPRLGRERWMVPQMGILRLSEEVEEEEEEEWLLKRRSRVRKLSGTH